MSRSAEPGPGRKAARQWSVILPPNFFAHELNDSERVIWLALDMMARQKAYCFPSYEKLAETTKRTPRAVRDAVSRLSAKGFVQTIHSGAKQSGRLGIARHTPAGVSRAAAARYAARASRRSNSVRT